MMLMKRAGHIPIQMNKMDKAEHFFEVIKETALEAISQKKIEQVYNIANFKIRLVFAGTALLPFITPALKHLQCEVAQKYDLTIYLWDTASTKIDMPFNNWKPDDYLEHGLIRGYNTENISTTFNLGSGTLNMYNSKENTALFWVRDATQLPYYETGAPLRDVFSWWAIRHGLQYAHAAAVGTKDGAVLLVGKGGSGKSTSALLCLDNPNLFYLGDDYVLISIDPIPYVYSLYCSAKLNADHVVNFPKLLEQASNLERLDNEKALIFIQNIYSEKIKNSMPLCAIILPKVTGRTSSSYASTSSSFALRALAPSSMFQLPGSTKKTFSYFSQFVRTLPAYTLYAGTNFNEVPKAIISIIKEQDNAN